MTRVKSGFGLGLVAVGLIAACGDNEVDENESTGESALTGTTFESGDGNLVPAAGADWTTAPALATKNDRPSGTNDNSFGQGSKEDGANVSVVTGSIPPNKNDLTRFYVSHENVDGNFFLYLAWERTNVLGSANMDFEFNQAPQTLSDTSLGAVTINRTAGDILITYDFGGSGTPTLGLLRWLTAGAGNTVSQCFSANALPCWGRRVDLSAAGMANGAVNTTTVTDSVESPSISLAANQFGEAGINLTAADIFPAGQCVNFASAFLKSRSSSSFTAEVKDFIAPGTANISNCGTINIHKTDGTNALAGAGFTLYSGAPSGTTCSGTASATCTTGADGNCTLATNVPFGTYCVAETTTPTNYYTADAQVATLSSAVTSVTLDFVDNVQPGALLITKAALNGSPLAGATFAVSVGGVTVGGGTSDASGHVCVTGLTIGTTYTVTETQAPPGYSIDTGPKSVTVTTYSEDCSGAPAQVSFTDSPLSNISCSFDSSSGLTAATIQCTGETESTSFLTHDLTGLVPGTYSCTFVITSN
ncbi:MAG TPA: SpaA isopeptide-forming pilin-related protein [Kofleriaceae bacterium]